MTEPRYRARRRLIVRPPQDRLQPRQILSAGAEFVTALPDCAHLLLVVVKLGERPIHLSLPAGNYLLVRLRGDAGPVPERGIWVEPGADLAVNGRPVDVDSDLPDANETRV